MPGVLPALRTTITVVNWLIATAWLARTMHWLRGLSLVPDLVDTAQLPAHLEPDSTPTLSVIVPARNEGAAIQACLQSLLATSGIYLEIIAVDDRSSDNTGAIMDRLAAVPTHHTMHVIHIAELPSGWTGKTHAMSIAAAHATGKWLLFTDGDVIFAPQALSLAVHFAEVNHADHVILYPTMIFKSFGERMMLSFLNAMAVWGPRPWKVSDPDAARDYLGIGAFNLLRRSAYDAIGGWSPLRLEIVEDLRMGYSIKHAGFRQVAVFGRDLLRIRWAEGALGVVNNMTKNLFAIFGFRLLLAAAAWIAILMLCLFPFASPFFVCRAFLPSVVVFVSVAMLYARFHRLGLPNAAFALTFPVGAALFLFALARSVVTTVLHQGVTWRGTFYPLKDLRFNSLRKPSSR